MLLYLYYNFENRPRWFKLLWGISNILRCGDFKITTWRQESYLRGHSSSRLLAVGQILIGCL